ncbi:hypothetical protein NX02_29515 [Sphingomonas sanxanigenens DSM 19645 = NX02]|uniref:Helix-turn-helix domain-containing protein n=1 Tax=Sphingomonas sanxanigenens DSM 19645 = NX02 TaxID=1123269 RepID=W0AK12_9SPHN|nr:hypothetical protein NX02_29515 [Sphingomonas sanxanigenens DSM 19645 = NX02]
MITAAARALAAGAPLDALNRVALRDDAPALALRGIAMAQLGDLDRARTLLREASRAFGPNETVARARCIVAEAEIALVSRDLRRPPEQLARARDLLDRHGDAANAAQARLIDARRLLLIGRLDAAEQALGAIDAAALRPAARTVHALAAAGIALRRLQINAARAALAAAAAAAVEARIPPLAAEVEQAAAALALPAARIVGPGGARVLRLDDVAALLASDALVIDACRYAIRAGGHHVALAGRPVLFALARALGEAWPGEVSRELLIQRGFGGREADESHRMRLRVEIARLRAVLKPVAGIVATRAGFVLKPRAGGATVLAPPVDEPHGAVLALLADGESWTSSGLALALGTSQRSVQRALDALAAPGRVEPVGRGRARRWLIPVPPAFATSLLLPGV